MATFQVTPVEMISSPNFFSYLPDKQWVVTHGVSTTLGGQLWISDGLGSRRYVLPGTATLKVTFLRADTPQQPSAAQSVIKTATVNSLDRSLFSLALSASESQTIISGSVIFEITDTNTANPSSSWVANYGLKKLMVGPGF